LENSSFLVSSVHPDELMQGKGFVARLSGATAEFISMWRCLMAGEQPFFMQGGQLCLALKPILPGWLFNKDNTLSSKFLGSTMIIYHNPTGEMRSIQVVSSIPSLCILLMQTRLN
jgi:hypothetical protein